MAMQKGQRPLASRITNLAEKQILSQLGRYAKKKKKKKDFTLSLFFNNFLYYQCLEKNNLLHLAAASIFKFLNSVQRTSAQQEGTPLNPNNQFFARKEPPTPQPISYLTTQFIPKHPMPHKLAAKSPTLSYRTPSSLNWVATTPPHRLTGNAMQRYMMMLMGCGDAWKIGFKWLHLYIILPDGWELFSPSLSQPVLPPHTRKSVCLPLENE